MKKIYLTNLQKEYGHQYYVRVDALDLVWLVDFINAWNADHPDRPGIPTVNDMLQAIVRGWVKEKRLS